MKKNSNNEEEEDEQETESNWNELSSCDRWKPGHFLNFTSIPANNNYHTTELQNA